MTTLSYLKLFAKDRNVAALMPSSRYATRAVMRALSPKHKYIVEYGPGDGVLTREILKRMAPDGKIVGIELNSEFVNELKNISDPRLRVAEGNVIDISAKTNLFGMPRIDAAVSGIPFSFIRSEQRETIVKNTHKFLQPDGQFVVYQFSLLMLPLLKKYFRTVSWKLEPRNLPPYFVMNAKK